jgi:hypothetical protein
MSPTSQETKMALMARAIEVLTDDMAETNRAIDALQQERNHALRWGIASLGAAVVAMGSWIFQHIPGVGK